MSTLPGTPVAVKRRTVRDLYRPLNAEVWPKDFPALTEAEALKAGPLLYDRFYRRRWYEERGKPYKRLGSVGKATATSGHRYSWVRRGIIYVNPGRGWDNLVHDLSHWCHQKLRPGDKPHSDNHRHLEKEMIQYVISHGWLDGKLKPKPKAVKPPKPAVDPIKLELERIAARTKAWTTKAKRAATALATLKKRQAVLQRRAAKQVRFSLTD